ncbi:ficolin-1-A-like [Glandiceps talaboti]
MGNGTYGMLGHHVLFLLIRRPGNVSVPKQEPGLVQILLQRALENSVLASLKIPGSCVEIWSMGAVNSGVHGIKTVSTGNFIVYCDFDTLGGGWITLQRRYDGKTDFNRTFQQYEVGFGNVEEEYWIGNRFISALTLTLGTTQLLIELTDWDSISGYVLYEDFYIESVTDNFQLASPLTKVDSNITVHPSAPDPLEIHVIEAFATYKDPTAPSCAAEYYGGWWFIAASGYDCAYSNLNGKYLHLNEGERSSRTNGIFWSSWHNNTYSFKETQMKVREKPTV